MEMDGDGGAGDLSSRRKTEKQGKARREGIGFTPEAQFLRPLSGLLSAQRKHRKHETLSDVGVGVGVGKARSFVRPTKTQKT